MAAARKKHVQQELFRHGGRRRGAGRKPRGARAGGRHEARPQIDGTNGLHIVLRVRPEIGSLRRPAIYAAVRDATVWAERRGRIRIVQLSIQRTHVHLLVEADSKERLAKGVLGFQVAAARNINRALGASGARRRGKVFAGRYHLVVITSPTQARAVISYVLNNWRKHAEDRAEGRAWMTDPYSTGLAFPAWRELGHQRLTPEAPTYGALVTAEPRSWLLRDGWRLVGSISAYEVPSGGAARG